MNRKIKNITLGLVVAAAALAMTPTASAQGFLGFSFGKSKHGKHVGFSIDIPLGHRRHAPRIHRHSSCCQEQVAGHYEIRNERVWVPRTCNRVWVRPVYRRVFQYGCSSRVLVRPGYWRNDSVGGFYRDAGRRVWIPGSWVRTCGY